MIYAQVLRPTAARRRCPAPPGASSASPGRSRARLLGICSSAGSAGNRASGSGLLRIRICSPANRTMRGSSTLRRPSTRGTRRWTAGRRHPPPRRQCFENARDARGRFATLSYLCGTIPAGGSWRDERGGLLADLTVPTSIIRGEFPGARDPVQRTRDALERLPFPAGGYIVRDARACLPWEQPEQTASALLSFLKLPEKDRGVQYVGT